MNSIEMINIILDYCSKEKYPDIHLNTGLKPKIRNHNGDIVDIDFIMDGENKIEFPILTKESIVEIIKKLAGEQGFNKFEENMELDCSFKHKDLDRFRVNCYMDNNGYSIALRIIPKEIPTFESLGLGDNIKEMCDKNKGLILVTGPTGSGKSTNLASMIDYISKTYSKHIITIEDPIEFVFKSEKSLINQREIGNSTKGFSQAIRASLREDPDVILIGEMRDAETIKAAITLAETGHLVISTLHTNDTVQSIDRIVDTFPAGQQTQVRMQLSMTLLGVVSQRLLPRADGNGRIASREVLLNNDAVKNLIITGKTHQLYSVLEVSLSVGMNLMDKYIIALYKKGLISKEVMMINARDKEGIQMLLD